MTEATCKVSFASSGSLSKREAIIPWIVSGMDISEAERV